MKNQKLPGGLFGYLGNVPVFLAKFVLGFGLVDVMYLVTRSAGFRLLLGKPILITIVYSSFQDYKHITSRVRPIPVECRHTLLCPGSEGPNVSQMAVPYITCEMWVDFGVEG